MKWKVGIAFSQEGSEIIELPDSAIPLAYKRHHRITEVESGIVLDVEHHEIIYMAHWSSQGGER